MKSSWKYPYVLAFAIIGLVMILAGLAFAYLSNPARFSENVRDDLAINLYTGAALLSTLVGAIIFLKAISENTIAMPPKTRRDINLGLAAGFGTQVAAFAASDPVNIVYGVLASLPFLCWGSMRFAEAKGYTRFFGVLGMLGVVGLIVLLVLPVRIEQKWDATE